VRLPFPVRIPLVYSAAFGLLLGAVQLLEGTPLYFSLCTFGFIFLASVAFNLVGGFSRPSGGYIFFYAVVAVILGLTYKAWLGESGDSNLLNPKTTMLAYLASSFGMCCSAFLARLLVPRRSLLEGMVRRLDLGAAALGCMVLGVGISIWGFIIILNGGEAGAAGSLYSGIRQLNNFMVLGIILGVTHTIRQSGGRRLISLPVALTITYMILAHGILTFSKEGLFSPILGVLIAAAAARFRFSFVRISVLLLVMIFAVAYVVPLIQAGKGRVTLRLLDNADTAIDLATSGELASDSSKSYQEMDDFVVHYYNQSHGLFDRLQMISWDDALIDTTEQGHVYGLSPVLFSFANVVPHFLWKGKPTLHQGNTYMHEIGYAHSARDSNDTTTGISFSPTGDAFHEARWLGVLVVAPLLWLLCFLGMDWLCGDARRSPWGLLMIASCAHVAPEGMLEGPVWLVTYGAFAVGLSAFLATYILPLFVRLIMAPGRRVILPRGQRSLEEGSQAG
jgi:hypothetical protein